MYFFFKLDLTKNIKSLHGRTPAINPDGFSSVSGTHVLEAENQLIYVILCARVHIFHPPIHPTAQ